MPRDIQNNLFWLKRNFKWKNQYIVNDSDLGSVLIWTNETIIDDEEYDNDDNDGTQTWASGWLFYT